ncbi:MAG TPA: RICIN domain-containing protein [Jatrophihabitantaceae bacterium]
MLMSLLVSFAATGVASASAAVPSRLDAARAAVARHLDATLTRATTKSANADTDPSPNGSTPTDPTPTPTSTPTPAPAPAAPANATPIKVPPTPTAATPTSTPNQTPNQTPTSTPTSPTIKTNKASEKTASDDATDPAGDPSDTYSLSSAAKDFLAGLDIDLGSGPVTGTLKGSTLTVQVGAPALPLTLPVGNDAVSFSGASLSIDESTGTLTLSASASTQDGASGTLEVSVAHANTTSLSGTDLSATVTLNALPVLGTTVDLSGTLAYTDGKVSASLTGTLDQDTVIAPNVLTIAKGSTITVSSKDGVTLNATAIVGTGDAQFTIKLSGAFSDEKNWNFSVDDDTNAPSFTPVDGLTITPAFSGSVTDKDGTISFDVSADEPVSWTPADSVTLAVNHVEVSNEAPPTTVACPSGVKDGDVWVDVKGGLTDTAAGLSATAEACVDPAAKAFTLTGTAKGSFGPSGLGFTLDDPTVTVDGDAKGVTVSATATLAVTAVSGTPTIPVTLAFGSDGSFTASASVDLSQFGLGTGSGTLVLSSKEIKQYTNDKITDPIDLPAGITVVLSYDPSSNNQVVQVFKALNLPVPNQVTAQATLSTSGFSIALDVDLGDGANGVGVLPNAPGGFQVYLDSLQLKLALTATSGTISIGGTALLQIPALYAGSSPSSVNLTLSGALTLTEDSVKIDAGFDLAAADGTWHDAFGIPGLSIGELAARIGIEEQPEDAGIPLPTLSFTVNNVVLPDEWANAIGEVQGAAVSATLDLDLDNPILSFAISPGTGQTAALEPLRIANDFTAAAGQAPLPDSVVDQLQIQDAQLLFAPLGGKDATGATVDPGASLAFDAVIGGKSVHVDGSVGLLPYPHLTAHVSIPSFGIGPVSFNNTTLAVDLEGNPADPKVDFDFSGGFSDSFTGIQFSASVDLGASTSLLNAGVTLHIAAGQPSYISGDAGLTGTVHADGGGFGFSASGYAYGYFEGQYIGTISFSYSTDSGALFAKLAQLGNQIAYWFRNLYGETDAQVSAALTQLGDTANQIAATLQSVFGDTDAQVASALNQIGSTAQNIAFALWYTFGDTDRQVAAAFNNAGLSPSQIASALQSVFGDSEAAVYNALQQIGAGGQSVLDAISGFFNTGSYWIYSNPWYSVPLFVDDSGGSQAAYNPIVQWTWNGGHNQDWYVLPTDSGYAEIVNRNSGQCLTAVGGAGAQVVQYPCYGWTTQQWYLGVYPGQSLNYTGHTVTNRWSGLNLDVNGGSTSAGAAIDTWYGTGNWNQWFTFEPAIG